MRRGYSLSQPIKWSGKHRELLQWYLGWISGIERICCILSVTEHFWLQDIVKKNSEQNEVWGGVSLSTRREVWERAMSPPQNLFMLK